MEHMPYLFESASESTESAADQAIGYTHMAGSFLRTIIGRFPKGKSSLSTWDTGVELQATSPAEEENNAADLRWNVTNGEIDAPSAEITVDVTIVEDQVLVDRHAEEPLPDSWGEWEVWVEGCYDERYTITNTLDDTETTDTITVNLMRLFGYRDVAANIGDEDTPGENEIVVFAYNRATHRMSSVRISVFATMVMQATWCSLERGCFPLGVVPVDEEPQYTDGRWRLTEPPFNLSCTYPTGFGAVLKWVQSSSLEIPCGPIYRTCDVNDWDWNTDCGTVFDPSEESYQTGDFATWVSLDLLCHYPPLYYTGSNFVLGRCFEGWSISSIGIAQMPAVARVFDHINPGGNQPLWRIWENFLAHHPQPTVADNPADIANAMDTACFGTVYDFPDETNVWWRLSMSHYVELNAGAPAAERVSLGEFLGNHGSKDILYEYAPWFITGERGQITNSVGVIPDKLGTNTQGDICYGAGHAFDEYGRTYFRVPEYGSDYGLYWYYDSRLDLCTYSISENPDREDFVVAGCGSPSRARCNPDYIVEWSDCEFDGYANCTPYPGFTSFVNAISTSTFDYELEPMNITDCLLEQYKVDRAGQPYRSFDSEYDCANDPHFRHDYREKSRVFDHDVDGDGWDARCHDNEYEDDTYCDPGYQSYLYECLEHNYDFDYSMPTIHWTCNKLVFMQYIVPTSCLGQGFDSDGATIFSYPFTTGYPYVSSQCGGYAPSEDELYLEGGIPNGNRGLGEIDYYQDLGRLYMYQRCDGGNWGYNGCYWVDAKYDFLQSSWCCLDGRLHDTELRTDLHWVTDDASPGTAERTVDIRGAQLHDIWIQTTDDFPTTGITGQSDIFNQLDCDDQGWVDTVNGDFVGTDDMWWNDEAPFTSSLDIIAPLYMTVHDLCQAHYDFDLGEYVVDSCGFSRSFTAFAPRVKLYERNNWPSQGFPQFITPIPAIESALDEGSPFPRSTYAQKQSPQSVMWAAPDSLHGETYYSLSNDSSNPNIYVEYKKLLATGGDIDWFSPLATGGLYLQMSLFPEEAGGLFKYQQATIKPEGDNMLRQLRPIIQAKAEIGVPSLYHRVTDVSYRLKAQAAITAHPEDFWDQVSDDDTTVGNIPFKHTEDTTPGDITMFLLGDIMDCTNQENQVEGYEREVPYIRWTGSGLHPSTPVEEWLDQVGAFVHSFDVQFEDEEALVAASVHVTLPDCDIFDDWNSQSGFSVYLRSSTGEQIFVAEYRDSNGSCVRDAPTGLVFSENQFQGTWSLTIIPTNPGASVDMTIDAGDIVVTTTKANATLPKPALDLSMYMYCYPVGWYLLTLDQALARSDYTCCTCKYDKEEQLDADASAPIQSDLAIAGFYGPVGVPPGSVRAYPEFPEQPEGSDDIFEMFTSSSSSSSFSSASSLS